MYQPAHLDSFLRLLISHLAAVLSEAERVIEWQLDEMRLDIREVALEQGEKRHRQQSGDYNDSQALFVLQMSQAREWVDRLGQLDPQVERQSDEFLAATFSIEKLLCDRSTRGTDYRLENRLAKPGSNHILRDSVVDHIDIEAMMCAIFELLGRLEEQYDLVEELYEIRQVGNGIPFEVKQNDNSSARIIPLFTGRDKPIRQDNDRKPG